MKEDLYKIRLKNTVDYEGKLNNHEDYLKILDILEKKSNFIGIAGKHEITDKFKNDIIKIEKSSSWWTEETSYVEYIYYIKASSELFDFLRKYETFCKTIVYKNEFFNYETLQGETTDFGVDDIAFFDNDCNILLATVTHEGFIHVADIVDKEFQANK